MTVNKPNCVMRKFHWSGDKRFTTFLDCLEGTSRAHWLDVVNGDFSGGNEIEWIFTIMLEFLGLAFVAIVTGLLTPLV